MHGRLGSSPSSPRVGGKLQPCVEATPELPVTGLCPPLPPVLLRWGAPHLDSYMYTSIRKVLFCKKKIVVCLYATISVRNTNTSIHINRYIHLADASVIANVYQTACIYTHSQNHYSPMRLALLSYMGNLGTKGLVVGAKRGVGGREES